MRRLICASIMTTALLSACSTRQVRLPEVVKVPVPVDCEIEKVPAPVYPEATADMNIFELAKVAMARLAIQNAEIVRLRAANNNPCPGGPK
jgi:hypothetical protein